MSAYAGLELLTTAVLMLDESLHVTYANPAAETLFAQGRSHLVGIPFHRALPNNDEFEQRLAHALENELGFNDNDLLLEVEGYPAHLHCVISPVEAAGEARLVLEFRELQQQMKIAREEKILEQQEANRELIRNLAHALENELGFNDNDLLLEVEGYPAHLHCVISPVEAAGEARLVLEFRELQQQLKIAREEKILEQQEANRELIRNLAHEIKNPLGGIRGAAQLLERELGDPELREFTQVIVKETDRLQSLMNRLLTPNRLPRVEMLNVHEVTERVRTLLLAEFPRGLEVKRDYDTSLPDLPGDKEQLIQAILNVARNAAQATQGHGEIRLTTRIARKVTIARVHFRHAVAVSIEDDGPGVPAELADRIFYPLVSGREGGTGLGLSLAQSFVSQHHGLIEFDSVPGRTRFTILLPVREGVNVGNGLND